MAKGRSPTSSYPSEYFELYIEAAKRPVKLKFDSRGALNTERVQINRCRLSMRDENHRLLSIAETVELVRDASDPTGCTLIAQPKGTRISKVFRGSDEARKAIGAGAHAPQGAPEAVQTTPKDAPQADESAPANVLNDFLGEK